jgi:hypothetical protein
VVDDGIRKIDEQPKQQPDQPAGPGRQLRATNDESAVNAPSRVVVLSGNNIGVPCRCLRSVPLPAFAFVDRDNLEIVAGRFQHNRLGNLARGLFPAVAQFVSEGKSH